MSLGIVRARAILEEARKPVFTGWLNKRVAQGSVQRRFFALRHSILLYHVAEETKRPKGAIPLVGSTVHVVDVEAAERRLAAAKAACPTVVSSTSKSPGSTQR